MAKRRVGAESRVNEAAKVMLEIELPEPSYSTCDCCGGISTNLTRFVSEDGDAFAIYYATFGENHPEKGVYMTIGIDDDWSETDSPQVTIACWLTTTDLEYQDSITDKDESPWSESKVLGRMMDRDAALSQGLIDEVFHLTDHIVEDDPVIKALLSGEIIH